MDQDSFRYLIIHRKEEIRHTLSQAEASIQPVELDQSKVGRLSRMDAIQQQQMNLESRRRMNLELVALEGALKRIDNNEFGLCFLCDEEIDPKRLEIDLAATMCIKCAQRQENR